MEQGYGNLKYKRTGSVLNKKYIVPEELLKANPYNREIMELLKKVSGV